MKCVFNCVIYASYRIVSYLLSINEMSRRCDQHRDNNRTDGKKKFLHTKHKSGWMGIINNSVLYLRCCNDPMFFFVAKKKVRRRKERYFRYNVSSELRIAARKFHCMKRALFYNKIGGTKMDMLSVCNLCLHISKIMFRVRYV
jgi:hypothetical protein